MSGEFESMKKCMKKIRPSTICYVESIVPGKKMYMKNLLA